MSPIAEPRSFLLPWVACRDLQHAVDELRAEAGRLHPLYGADVLAVARRVDQDDFLFEVRAGSLPFAVVHLTMKGSREANPKWPSVKFFDSWDEWVERCMKPDASDHARVG